MRLRLANSAMRRTLRSSSSPISRRLPSRSSSWRRRRAENTVMMMSDISGIWDIKRQHRLTRHLDHPGVSSRAHRHRPGAAVQEGDFAHELRRTERRGQMAFVGIGIDDLDLAFLDIDKAIHRLAGPREKRYPPDKSRSCPRARNAST